MRGSSVTSGLVPSGRSWSGRRPRAPRAAAATARCSAGGPAPSARVVRQRRLSAHPRRGRTCGDWSSSRLAAVWPQVSRRLLCSSLPVGAGRAPVTTQPPGHHRPIAPNVALSRPITSSPTWHVMRRVASPAAPVSRRASLIGRRARPAQATGAAASTRARTRGGSLSPIRRRTSGTSSSEERWR